MRVSIFEASGATRRDADSRCERSSKAHIRVIGTREHIPLGAQRLRPSTSRCSVRGLCAPVDYRRPGPDSVRRSPVNLPKPTLLMGDGVPHVWLRTAVINLAMDEG